MKGKFLKGFGKGIASLMVAAMLFTGNGITTLAAGVQADDVISQESTEVTEEETILYSSEDSDASADTQNEVSSNVYQEGLTVGDLLDEVLLNEAEGSSSDNAAEDGDEELEEEEQVVTAEYEYTSGGVKCEINGTTMTITVTGDKNGNWPWKESDGNMKAEAKAVTTIVASGKGLTNASSMFADFINARSIDVSGLDTSQVTNMMTMFANCQSLDELNLSKFDTSKVENMWSMFEGCVALSEITFSDKFTTENCLYFATMFSLIRSDVKNNKLTTLDLRYFDMSKASLYSNFINGCSALTDIYTPKKLAVDITLPKTMYDDSGNEYKALPKGLDTSIHLTTTVPTSKKYTVTAARGLTNGYIEIYDAADTTALTNKAEGKDSAEVSYNSYITIRFYPDNGYTLDNLSSTSTKYGYDYGGGDPEYEGNITVGDSYISIKLPKPIQADDTFTATFKSGELPTVETVKVKVGTHENGTITINNGAANADADVAKESKAIVVVKPDNGYVVDTIVGNYVLGTANKTLKLYNPKDASITNEVLSDGSIKVTIPDIAYETTINATMKVKPTTFTIKGLADTDNYTVTAKNGTSALTITDGVISNIEDGTEVSITVTPKSGKIIKSITFDDGSSESGAAGQTEAYTFKKTIRKDITVTIKADMDYKYLTITQPTNGTITYSLDGGKTYDSSADSIGVAKGSVIKVKVTPNGGYQILSVKVNDTAQTLKDEDKSGYTFDVTLDADKTVTAEMEQQTEATYTISGLASTDMYTVTSTSTITDGKISGLADKATASITVSPKTGYVIKKITTKKASDTTASTVSGSENQEKAVSFDVTIAADNVEVAVEAEAVQAATYSVTVKNYSSNAPFTITSTDVTIPSTGVISGLSDGAKIKLTVTPKTGFYIKNITTTKTGEASAVVSGSENQEKAVSFDVTISSADVTVAVESGNYRTLTLTQPTNGTIEAAAKGSTSYSKESVTVKEGGAVTVKVTPDAGYQISSVKLGSLAQEVTNEKGFSFDVTNLNQNFTVTAEMAAIMHTISVNQPENGTIKVNNMFSANGSYQIQEGSNATITITANEGSTIQAVTVNGKAQTIADTEKSAKTITLQGVSKDYTIAAEMKVTEYEVIVESTDCTITIDGKALPADGKVSVKHGGSVSLNIVAADGKKITSVTTDDDNSNLTGLTLQNLVYTVSCVKKAVTVTITVEDLGENEEYEDGKTFTVSVNQTKGGTITATNYEIKDGKIVVSITLSTIYFKITADEGKKITALKVDGKEVQRSSGNEYVAYYTLSNISKDQTFTAEFEDIKNTVTVNCDGTGKETSDKGSVSIKDVTLTNGKADVVYGTEITITAQPKAGYEVSSIKVGNVNKGAVSEVKATIKEDTTITVTFVKETTYEITVETEGQGDVTAEGLSGNKVTVVKGKDITLTLTPKDKDKYYVEKILLDGNDTGENGDTFTLTNVQGNHTVKVVFKEIPAGLKPYQVGIIKAVNGTISTNIQMEEKADKITIGNEQITVNQIGSVMSGQTIKVTFKPADGYMLDTVKVNNQVTPVNYNSIILTITENTVIEATFKKEAISHYITISTNNVLGGEITASPNVLEGNKIKVDSNDAKETITIKTNEGYKIVSVVIDGESREVKDSAIFTFEFTDFTKDHNITVVYEKTGLTLKLDGIGEISFQEGKDGKLTTSANLIPSDDKKPYLGANFAGWFTAPNGKGVMVIDRNGAIVEDAIAELKAGANLYADWDYITLVEKQKINIKSYFQTELDTFLAANPKGKYRFTVYTEDSLNGKYAKDTKSKIGSASKSGLFTAKKAGVARIVLETYDKATKSYVAGAVKLYVAVEKPVATKQTLSYIGETAEVSEIFSYDYAGVLGNTPNTGSIEYYSTKPARVSVDSKTGKITAVGYGTATIKAVYTYYYDPLKKPSVVTKSVTITVKAPKFSASKVSLKAGKMKLNKLRYTYEGDKVSWSVENPAIASVDQTGLVTALAAGETTVVATVTFDDGHVESYSYLLKVKP